MYIPWHAVHNQWLLTSLLYKSSCGICDSFMFKILYNVGQIDQIKKAYAIIKKMLFPALEYKTGFHVAYYIPLA